MNSPLAVRALLHAPQSLSLTECLGQLVSPVRGKRVADRLLRELGAADPERDPWGALETLSANAELGDHSLPPTQGLGASARARILAALALAKKLRQLEESRRLMRPLDSSRAHLDSLAKIPSELRFESREWIGIVPVGRRGGFSPLQLVARGVRTHVNLSPADVFRPLLAQHARGFCLYHNHPSGRCLPSPADFELTLMVRDLSQSLGIAFLGHGIVGPGSEHWIDSQCLPSQNPKSS